MKKVLRTLLIFLLAGGTAQAQFGTGSRVININFNRGTSPANDTTANGVDAKFYESPNSGATSVVGTFFPTGGAYRLRALSYSTSAQFKLTGGLLSIKNANENKIAKVAAYNIADGDALVKFSFTLDLTNYTGDNALIIAFGNTAGGSTLISSSAPFTSAQGDIFGAFRVIKSGNLTTQFKPANGTGQTNTAVKLIKENASQVVEIFANSNATAKTYSYPGVATPVNIPANTYHIYVDGVKHAEDFPKVGTTYTQTTINAISFTQGGSASVETSVLSNLQVTYPALPLPVSLTSFTGKNEANGIRLNWKTASELNNDHFDVLRSTDGKMFNTLTSVSGNGTTNKVNTYSYLDNAPASGTNYYQLSQVDKDGTATKSATIAVDHNLGGQQAFTLNVDGNTLNASFGASANGTATINIHDLSGRSVFSKSFSVQKGSNSTSFNVPAFNAGIYVATLTQNGESKSVKFVK